MMAYLIYLTGNIKTAKFIFRVRPAYLLVPDKASKTFIAEGGPEGLQFGRRALGQKFNPAVGQIADGAGDLEAGGDRFGGVAESNALDAARIENLEPAAGKRCGGRRGVYHGRMKPKLTSRRNVFCRVPIKEGSFFRILFDPAEDFP
jgi:hypothetical protein